MNKTVSESSLVGMGNSEVSINSGKEKGMREDDEPPLSDSNFFFSRLYNRLCRVVFSVEANRLLHGEKTEANIYFGGGRKFMGMASARECFYG